MGAIRAIFDETENKIVKLGWWGKLSIKGTRSIQASRHRYCLQDNMLYLPKKQEIADNHKISWLRFRVEQVIDFPELEEFNTTLPYSVKELYDNGIGVGLYYSRRHIEEEGKRKAVNAFCAQNLIDLIAKNPEALTTINKEEFETLVAELFARKGFEVDLYRKTKDDGIDFIAIKGDQPIPLIMAVQCKHPDIIEGKKPNTLGVATIREIYGVCKANDFDSCLAVTSSTYSSPAKTFSELKPQEIDLANRDDLLDWILKYRWNINE